MRTGRMLTVDYRAISGAVPDGNTSGQRPDIVPGVSIYPAGGPTFDQWLNPAAFAIPANGTWGNAGRSSAAGPGLAQVDFALQKETPHHREQGARLPQSKRSICSTARRRAIRHDLHFAGDLRPRHHGSEPHDRHGHVAAIAARDAIELLIDAHVCDFPWDEILCACVCGAAMV